MYVLFSPLYSANLYLEIQRRIYIASIITKAHGEVQLKKKTYWFLHLILGHQGLHYEMLMLILIVPSFKREYLFNIMKLEKVIGKIIDMQTPFN